MKEQEAQYMQRILDSNANLRARNAELVQLMQDLLDPDMYGWAITQEIRKEIAAVYFRKGKPTQAPA